MGTATRVGIVAIGRNEGERLRRCLTSVEMSKFPLVYVDSGSIDGSRDLAIGLGAKLVDLDIAKPFTAARARNAGLAALLDDHPALEYVQFVDGDCEFERGWMETATIFLDAHPESAVTCGRRRERFPSASLYNRIADAEWNTPAGLALACGGDAMMRSEAIAAVGAYDAELAAGEEPELCLRLRQEGWTIWRLDQPMTIHDAAMEKFSQWWLRAVRSGMGYAQVWSATRRHPVPLYRRESLRALIWSIGVPTASIVAAAALHWSLILLAPTMWGGQFIRLACQHGRAQGALLLIGKAAETLGILRYLRGTVVRSQSRTVFYK